MLYLFGSEPKLDVGRGYRRLLDGPPIRFNPELQRPQITFLSGRDGDDTSD
jgi:hypothetical protein